MARERFRARMARAMGAAGLEVAAAIEEELLGDEVPTRGAKRLPLDATPISGADIERAHGSVTRLVASRRRAGGPSR